MGTVVDGEVQRVDIGASGVWLRMVEGVNPGSGVCRFVPGELFTCSHVISSVVMLVNSEV